MQTPICDFVRAYADAQVHRLHMPGHKGNGVLGIEALDITEIHGADSLYQAQGIIAQSQDNASALFGCRTLYSTEGASQCIRAMLYLVSLYARRQGSEPLVVAARNAHKAFLTAVAMLDVQVQWLYPAQQEGYLSCDITAEQWEQYLQASAQKPTALYLTSPDYPGHISDIRALAEVCRRHGVLLVVDNAHGAYLKFLPQSLHPIDLGAHLCCDSAHKTLPVLTGGAYLHISPDYPKYSEGARGALSLFASTSPSYLTLCSLDLCNRYLSRGFEDKLEALCHRILTVKSEIKSLGFEVMDSEPLKIVIKSGGNLSHQLKARNIEVEYSDGEYTVLMLTVENSEEDLSLLLNALSEIKPENIKSDDLGVGPHDREMSIREAIFAKSELVPVENAKGRICASPTVSCPPAVPIVVSGERITEEDVKLFYRYSVDKVSVVKENK